MLLFISPWILAFSGDVTATRAAWITGVVVAIFAVAALVQFAEWEEWISLLLGVWMIVAPWVVGFSAIGLAVAAFVVLGVVVARPRRPSSGRSVTRRRWRIDAPGETRSALSDETAAAARPPSPQQASRRAAALGGAAWSGGLRLGILR